MVDRLRGGPLWQLTLTRLREFVRDPAALFWTFGFPILLAIGLGIAFREAPEETFVAGVLAEHRHELPVLDDPRIELRDIAADDIERELGKGRVDVVLEHDLEGGAWVYRYDAARPESGIARLVVDAALQRSAGRTDPLPTRFEAVDASGSRYIDFLVPGLVGLNIMSSAIWGMSYSIVDARRRKLLKRLLATPMSRAHFLLSYMLSRLSFLVLEVAALVGFGWLMFDVEVHGSLAALAFVSVLGALSWSGLGTLVAARPNNTEVAAGWSNLFMLPMWLLSGPFFSYERFPEVVHPLIRWLPLTALIDALRGIMNHGVTLLSLWHELMVLGVWGVLGFAVALRIFRWQ